MKHLILDIFKAWVLTIEQNRGSLNQELHLSPEGKDELKRFIDSLSTKPKDYGSVIIHGFDKIDPSTMNEDSITIYGYNFKISSLKK